MVVDARACRWCIARSEREAAYETRAQVLNTIGALRRGEAAPEDARHDDAPLLGTPEEIIRKLERLRAGGVENILLVDPRASVANLRAFAAEVIGPFGAAREAAA